MKERILKGWTFMRVLYTIAGIAVVAQSYAIHAWVGIIFGVYFTAMGVFGFGCAGGNCYGRSFETNAPKEPADISFEEIKNESNGNK